MAMRNVKPLFSRSARRLKRLFGDALENSNYLINWSRRHRYIYNEIPKAACSTIKLTLQRIELDDRAYDPPDLHRRGLSPLLSPRADPAGFLQALASPEFFRFCFVRNPYTRTLSAYLDKLAADNPERAERLTLLGLPQDRAPTLSEFLGRLCDLDPARYDVHWARQSDLLTPHLIRFDFVGRFERFGEDFPAVLARIGHDASWLTTVRAHRTGAAEQLHTLIGREERSLIERIFAPDFEMFEYARDLPA